MIVPPYWTCPRCGESYLFRNLEDLSVGIKGENDIQYYRIHYALEEDSEKIACNGEDECQKSTWYIFICPKCGKEEEYMYGDRRT